MKQAVSHNAGKNASEEDDGLGIDEEALASASGTELAAPGQFDDSGLGGEWGNEDLNIPYLSLVNKTGNLSDHFTPGTFVFNKEVVVADGKTPIEITVLTAQKYYVEDIPFDPDILPKRFFRLEDARAEGYSLEWEAEKRVKPCAALTILVPVPMEYGIFMVPENVAVEVAKQAAAKLRGDPVTSYAKAAMICQGGAFKSVGKPVATAGLTGHLRDGLHKGGWSLTSELRSNNKNSWYAPVIRANGRHPAAFADWVTREAL